MTIEQMAGLFLALGLMLVGLIGSVVPAIPGASLVLVGAIAHRFYFGETSASNTVLIVLVLLTLFSLVLDYIATIVGAKRFGATWRGVVGALLGGLIGLLLLPIPGIIIGPFIGALLCEMLGGRAFHPSARAGFGALLGMIVGALGQAGVCAVMMGIFTVSVITRSGAEIPRVVGIPVTPQGRHTVETWRIRQSASASPFTRSRARAANRRIDQAGAAPQAHVNHPFACSINCSS